MAISFEKNFSILIQYSEIFFEAYSQIQQTNHTISVCGQSLKKLETASHLYTEFNVEIMNQISICEAIQKRKSCRAYLDQNVDSETIREILKVARWAPSGVNHQPVQVAVLGEETKRKLSKNLIEQYTAGIESNPDYIYCPKEWSDTYKLRRRECGQALYGSLSISRDDIEGRRKHWEKNYHFFHAPVGLIIYIEKNMPIGSWVDAGLFIQNILLAAQEFGLATCPQAAFAEYPDVVRKVLSLESVDIICGIAMGYEDVSHPLNSYRTQREPVETFTRWYV